MICFNKFNKGIGHVVYVTKVVMTAKIHWLHLVWNVQIPLIIVFHHQQPILLLVSAILITMTLSHMLAQHVILTAQYARVQPIPNALSAEQAHLNISS
mgnify:CR=1 FL=1